MTAALYILAALAVAALVLKLTDKKATPSPGDDVPGVSEAASGEEECCGMHITCERDSLLASVSADIEYYDDEELDVYRGRGEDEYSDAEIEQFRDVLLTLRPDDIAGWARSVQLRGITLPGPVREELLMMASEERSKRNIHD